MVKAKTQQRGDSAYVEVPPNASRTLTALREMGYDSFAAVMDLLDNSIDAGAKDIRVTVKDNASGKALAVDIVDDGRGMDRETLAEALRLGSDTKHDARKDLGKFGLGLVTAGISLARNVWVLSREEGKQAYEATLDLDVIAKQDKFLIALRPAANSKTVLDLIGNRGTLVRLGNIDRITDRNVSRFAANLRTRLAQVYRHYLAEGVAIWVNGRRIIRTDPLMLDHPQTEVVLDTEIDLGDGTKAKLTVVDLPDLGQAGNSEANIFPHNSGFYVVRNGREIIAGETFGFYRHHHSYSHFRAELSYHGDSTVFHEDVKKSSIHPDDRLLDKLRRLTERLIADSGRRDRTDAAPVKLTHRAAESTINARFALLANGPTKAALAAVQKQATEAPPPAPLHPEPRKRGRPTKEEAEQRRVAAEAEAAAQAKNPTGPQVQFIEVDAGEKGRFFSAEQKADGTLTIAYNTRHPLVRLVAESKQRQASAVLDLIAFSLARAEKDVEGGSKVVNRTCDYLALLAAPGGSTVGS